LIQCRVITLVSDICAGAVGIASDRFESGFDFGRDRTGIFLGDDDADGVVCGALGVPWSRVGTGVSADGVATIVVVGVGVGVIVAIDAEAGIALGGGVHHGGCDGVLLGVGVETAVRMGDACRLGVGADVGV